MMNVVLSITNVALPVLYLMVFGFYLWLFRSDNPTPRRIASRFTLFVVLFHLAAEIARTVAYGRLPMGSPVEFVSALALAILVTYLFIERRWRVKNTGFLPTGLAFVAQFVASALSTSVPHNRPFLSDPGFAGHAVLVLLAYTALTLSFVYALLYLVLARQLGRHQFGLLFRRLPSLDVLERMSVGAVELGVPLLFASLVLGHLWMYSLADRVDPAMAAQLSPYDPKILVSWVILLGYLGGLAGYRFLGWRGRRMNVLAVSAFVMILFAMGFIRHFVPSFHDFRDRQAAETPAPPDDGARLSVPEPGGAA
jgi:ABC-type uncharacterized transport system permease subunit